jgi:hypothetical protein
MKAQARGPLDPAFVYDRKGVQLESLTRGPGAHPGFGRFSDRFVVSKSSISRVCKNVGPMPKLGVKDWSWEMRSVGRSVCVDFETQPA